MMIRGLTQRYESTNPIVRFLALDHPWGVFLGFPGYLLLEPKWSSTDGSHFNPQSRLFDRAPKDERQGLLTRAPHLLR
jgi:omega-3 fatty acid desaturase (delta-15 desaturase)